MNLNASLFSLLRYTPVSPRVSAMYYYMPLLGIPVLVFCCCGCCVCCWWCVVVVVVLVVFNNIALAEFINLVFTRMPGASYRRRFKPLFVQRLSSAIN